MYTASSFELLNNGFDGVHRDWLSFAMFTIELPSSFAETPSILTVEETNFYSLTHSAFEETRVGHRDKIYGYEVECVLNEVR